LFTNEKAHGRFDPWAKELPVEFLSLSGECPEWMDGGRRLDIQRNKIL
jgi:hypothetical protein